MEEGRSARKFKKVGEVQGNTTGGSISIDANSAIRRTCNIDMVITDSSFLISEDSKIWMDKWFKLKIGIRSIKTGEIVWFNKGIYAIQNPSVKLSLSEKTLSLSGLDIMSTLDGTLGGTLGNITKLPADISINEAIKTTVWQLGGISQSQIYIEDNDLMLPYDIEKTPTDTVYSILDEIRNLYMDMEMFFDENGRFIYQKIKNRYVENPVPSYANDIVQFRFLEEHEMVIDYSLQYLFDNVKNKIQVWGKLLDSGIQTMYELVNDDPRSPFNISTNMGVIPFAYVDNKIFNDEQAKQRARYELYQHSNMSKQLSISLVPLYFLDVNTLVEFSKPEIDLDGKYLIDSITIPLNATDNMSLVSHEVYAQ